ncbi:MAG: hypothetical protein KF886_03800 [Candidatus Hydrogenedentes bacterium]|nr:hypothetical protein [Candidatus Hydrogenedentota bacterium]
MWLKPLRRPVALLLVSGVFPLVIGCSSSQDPQTFTRLHLENESREPVTFLAIGTSEADLATAENRLSQPLPPRAVYSAIVSRPGNYWVRAEIEAEGYTIERIEGPVRLGRGVHDWRFQQVDARPLYSGRESAGAASAPPGPSTVQTAAGLISFRSN